MGPAWPNSRGLVWWVLLWSELGRGCWWTLAGLATPGLVPPYSWALPPPVLAEMADGKRKGRE